MAGRGWVACTPIVSARATIGMLFNDPGLSRAPVDETKQEHAAILCALLATILELPLECATKRRMVRAFNKLLWLQNDLIVRHYAA